MSRYCTLSRYLHTTADCFYEYSSAANPMGSMVPYETCERQITSFRRSSKTNWYFAESNTSISSLPAVPQAETGHLYVHLDSSTCIHQYWMFGASNEWQSVSEGSEYPLNHDRVLSIRTNGEPSWVARESVNTTQLEGRNEKAAYV